MRVILIPLLFIHSSVAPIRAPSSNRPAKMLSQTARAVGPLLRGNILTSEPSEFFAWQVYTSWVEMVMELLILY